MFHRRGHWERKKDVELPFDAIITMRPSWTLKKRNIVLNASASRKRTLTLTFATYIELK